LKPHSSSAAEIADLLALAGRDLKDSGAKGLSDDWKFNIAYNAALQASNAALAASGYSVTKGESNHFRVIGSLEYTIGLDKSEVSRFARYRKKRSMCIYDAAGVISRTEATEIRAFLKELVDQVRAWLEANHPELTP